MGRRIILLLDGTWNDSDFGPFDTNIVRLRGLIANSSDAGDTKAPYETVTISDPANMVTKPESNSRSNIVFYERGVGTGTLIDRLFGGTIGLGLDDNIRRAYKFLSFHYKPGDEIFVFGFSRGSYTARSLVGYIASAGLLLSDKCNEENERKAWDFYRTPTNDRLPGVWHDLEPYVNDRDQLRISCLAVFDTVGALGIPLEVFVHANRERYEFHDVDLSSITSVNLQAIAIDERRWPFQAALWRKPQFKKFNTVTEQVWFPGAHADVGGGYVKEAERGKQASLDSITLDWMLRRLKVWFSDFPIKEFLILSPNEDGDRDSHYEDWVNAELHNSRTGVYKCYPNTWRTIANSLIPSVDLRKRETSTGYDRHSISINEMVHISALEKVYTSLPGSSVRSYAPKNLISVLSRIENTYTTPARTQSGNEILVVDWDGSILDPYQKLDNARVTETLFRASQRKNGVS
jgi:hypothetical protein